MTFQRVVVLLSVLALSLGCNQGKQPQQAAGNAKDAKLPAAKGDGGDRTEEAKAVVKRHQSLTFSRAACSCGLPLAFGGGVAGVERFARLP